MAWTLTDIEAVEAAILAAATQGWAEIDRDGFRGKRYLIKELTDLRAIMQSAVNGSNGGVMSHLAKFDKG